MKKRKNEKKGKLTEEEERMKEEKTVREDIKRTRSTDKSERNGGRNNTKVSPRKLAPETP